MRTVIQPNLFPAVEGELRSITVFDKNVSLPEGCANCRIFTPGSIMAGRYLVGAKAQMSLFHGTKFGLPDMPREEVVLARDEGTLRAAGGTDGTCRFREQIGDDCWRNKSVVVYDDIHEEGFEEAFNADRKRDQAQSLGVEVDQYDMELTKAREGSYRPKPGQLAESTGDRIARLTRKRIDAKRRQDDTLAQFESLAKRAGEKLVDFDQNQPFTDPGQEK